MQFTVYTFFSLKYCTVYRSGRPARYSEQLLATCCFANKRARWLESGPWSALTDPNYLTNGDLTWKCDEVKENVIADLFWAAAANTLQSVWIAHGTTDVWLNNIFALEKHT